MTQYMLSSEAACAVLDDGAVILNLRTRRYYSLNETGAAIWAMLERTMPVEAIAAELVTAYEIDPGGAKSAVSLMLEELASVELVSLEES